MTTTTSTTTHRGRESSTSSSSSSSYGGCALDYVVATRRPMCDADDVVRDGAVFFVNGVNVNESGRGDAVLARVEAPLRYVHGAGVVPSTSMPFRDKIYAQKTRAACCEYDDDDDATTTTTTTTTTTLGDVVVIRASRALPVIGEEANMGSCGGSEWNEDVAFVRERVKILRGVCRGSVDASSSSSSSSSSFSAGTLALCDDGEAEDDEWVRDDGEDDGVGVSFAPQIDGAFTLHSCLAHGDVRARIEHHVTYDASARELCTHGFTMCVERENACVNDFSHKPAASMREDVFDDAHAWIVHDERRVDFGTHFDENSVEFTSDAVYVFPHRSWARVSANARVVRIEHGGVNAAGVRRVVTRRYYTLENDRGALLAVVVRHDRKS